MDCKAGFKNRLEKCWSEFQREHPTAITDAAPSDALFRSPGDAASTAPNASATGAATASATPSASATGAATATTAPTKAASAPEPAAKRTKTDGAAAAAQTAEAAEEQPAPAPAPKQSAKAKAKANPKRKSGAAAGGGPPAKVPKVDDDAAKAERERKKAEAKEKRETSSNAQAAVSAFGTTLTQATLLKHNKDTLGDWKWLADHELKNNLQTAMEGCSKLSKRTDFIRDFLMSDMETAQANLGDTIFEEKCKEVPGILSPPTNKLKAVVERIWEMHRLTTAPLGEN